ncbi:MAG: hypothetical protein B7Z55_03760 [Planctomycetales bacterium 12-60-4]|nr:MAG: hypothetical protein B7Z55_03760 [Planctomycetales bacterium 12-60-4]
MQTSPNADSGHLRSRLAKVVVPVSSRQIVVSHPPAEISIEEDTVRRLLETQCPDFADQPLRFVDEGWDNVTYLVGERHAVRLPRREAAVALLVNEQRWLPLLATRLPIEVPVPVHAGETSEWFRWPWSIVNWIPGGTAETHEFQSGDAALLAETLVALHQPAPDDAPVNPFRGVPLLTRHEVLESRMHLLQDHPAIDESRLKAIWRDACAAPVATVRAWLHGDLHPRNVVIRDGSLAGLIDWGDLNGGDAATDVACAWMLIDAPLRRREFLQAYGASDAVRWRAMGWAVHIGLGLVDSGEPRHVPLGLATLNRVIADA